MGRQYGIGTRRYCLVNPHDPAQAVLTRQLGANVWIGLLPLLFVLAGGWGIIHALRRKRSSVVPGENINQ